MSKNLFALMVLLVVFSLLVAYVPTGGTTASEDVAADEAAEAEAAEVEEAVSENSPAGVDPNGQTVVWWHNHSGVREEKLLAIVDKFNAENEYGIMVEAVNQGFYRDIREKMEAGVVSGELPQIVVGYQHDQAFYASVDALVDMDIYVNDEQWGLTADEKADFSPGIYIQDLHPAFDNMRLGFPPNRSMEVLYMNKTWLAELGFDPHTTITPKVFEEVSCAAAEAKDDGTGGYIIRFNASQIAAAALARGGSVLSEDGTGYAYDTPELLDYFTQIKRMYDNGCAWVSPRYHDAEFAARQAIFYIGSTSGLPFAQGSMDAAENTDEWGIAPQPYTTDEPRQNLYGGSVLMPKSTPAAELAAWIFIKWFVSPEAQVEWVKASNYFSPRYSVGNMLADYIEDNPKYADAVQLLPYASFEPQLISYTEVRNAANEAFQNIINADADIAETLAELDALANDLQAEADTSSAGSDDASSETSVSDEESIQTTAVVATPVAQLPDESPEAGGGVESDGTERTSPAQDSALPSTGGIVTENETSLPFILSVGALVALLMGAVFGLLRRQMKL